MSTPNLPHQPPGGFAGPAFNGLLSAARYFARPYFIFRDYRLADLRPDFVAGLTVSLVVLPQAIAYALIADLPPAMGVYAAIAGSVVGALWGSTHQLQIGPTNAASLLALSVLTTVAASGSQSYVLAAGLLAVLTGIFQTGMGLAHLGMLTNFVSDSVIVGFTAGAGTLIFVNQLRTLLRLSVASSADLPATLADLITHATQTHLPSLVIGLATLLLVLLIQRLKRGLPAALIALTSVSALVALFRVPDIRVIGAIPAGLPPLAPLPITDLDLIRSLSTGALAMAAIGLVEAMSIARNISAQTGQRLNSNQEFVGLGLSNIASGLFSGFSCSGSFTRSAVNLRSGARTSVSSLFTGAFVLLTLLALGPLAAHIPLSALAGVIILIAFGMIDRREIARIWAHGPRGDRAIMLATLLGTLLLPLQFAVLSGILMSLAFYILQTSTPRVRVVVPNATFQHMVPQDGRPACPQLGIIEILGDLYFGAVRHIEEFLLDDLGGHPGQRLLLLRMQGVERCDISGIHALEHVVKVYRSRGGDVYVTRVRRPVMEIIHQTGFYATLGADHFLPGDDAVSQLFNHVLDPAICIYECPVRVFRECQNLPKSEPGAGHLPLPQGKELDRVRYITPTDLWHALHEPDPPLVIDVREPREFRLGHVPGALSRPLGTLLGDEDQSVPAGRKVVFVCRGGRRSSRTAALFQERGNPQVYALQGGMLAWEHALMLTAVEES